MNFEMINSGPIRQLLNVISVMRLSVFLLLCFVLGGTSQDIVGPKLFLYLISLVVIGACLTTINSDSAIWKVKGLLILFGTFLLGHLLYLIPLPAGVWSNLPGRDFIVKGYEILGVELPWLPLSVTPEKTLFSLFDFLPPFALLLLLGTVVKTHEIKMAIKTIGVFVIISVIMVILQVANIHDGLYIYDFTNTKSAVGFFSNANHYGVFMLMSIPLIMCIIDFSINDYVDYNRALTFSIICIVAALLGIGLCGSLGSFLLILPVLAGTGFIWSTSLRRKKFYLIGILGSLIAVFLFDIFIWENLQQDILSKLTSVDSSVRQTLFEKSAEIAKTFFPVGTGPGSFADVYKLFEDVGRKTIPHAHNDYIEMFVEFGILGPVWIICAFIWIGRNILKALTHQKESQKMSQYLSISIMIVFVHSIFDYSLRTISVMTLLVFCLSILSLSNQKAGFQEGESL